MRTKDVEEMKRIYAASLCALLILSTVGFYNLGNDALGEPPEHSENAFTILVVDAVGGGWGTVTYYTNALSNIGAAYTLWDVYGNSGPPQGKPTAVDMSAYSVVIWVPDPDMNWDGSAFNPADETEVGLYLDGGGCFLLSSITWTDWTAGGSYSYGPGDFAYDYFGLVSVSGWSGDEIWINGTTGDPVYGGFGPAFQDWSRGGNWGGFPPFMSDDINAKAPGAVYGLFNDDTTGDGGAAGVYNDGGAFRTAFWGFPFETIPNPDAEDLMNRTLEWFYQKPGVPQMTIDKWAPAIANPGETILYIIDYTVSSSMAYGVTVTEAYPSNAVFTDANPLPTVGDNIWILGDLPAGTFGTIYINVTIGTTASGTVTNQVFLDWMDSIGTPYSDSDTAVTTLINPFVQISKWAPAQAFPGETITYWINYSNTGTDWAYNVEIVETYPADVTFVSAIPAPSAGDNIWSIGSLAPGASGSIQVTVQVNIDALLGVMLNNEVTAHYENAAGIPYQRSDNAITMVIGPAMTITKTGPVSVEPIGEVITYKLSFTNIGNGDAFNVVVTEFYHPWCTFISANPPPDAGNNIWLVGTVGPSVTVDIYVTVQVDIAANGSFENYVELDYENGAGIVHPTVNDTHVTYVMSGDVPIRINSNADFDAAHGVTGGAGTLADPWVIENKFINGTGRGNCIYVGNTTEPFTIRNCTLFNAGGYGIATWPFYGDIGLICYNAQHGIIENNTVSDCIYRGIYLYTDSCNNKVMNNTAWGNSQSSIHLSNRSNHNFVYNNTVDGSTWGIILFQSANNTIQQNEATGCGQYGLYMVNSTYNTFYDNTATGCFDSGMYLDNSSYNDIIMNNCSDNLFRAGIAVELESNYNNLTDNICLNNTFEGISIDSSHWNTVDNNLCLYNVDDGVYLYQSSWNTIKDNDCSFNNWTGMRLSMGCHNNSVINNEMISNRIFGLTVVAHYNTIYENLIEGNQWGLILDGNYSRVYHNSFIGNVNQAYEVGTNTWDNGYPSGGNFWSDYAGIDLYHGPVQDLEGSDGIGDTPYDSIFGTTSMDNYPLTAPFDYIEYNVPLQEGWNLISIPVRQLDWSLNSVLESIAGQWDVIQTYDTPTDTWISHSIHRPPVLNDLNEMNHFKSYWVNITQPGVTLTIKGDAFGSPLSMPLYAGWNLVGYPSQVPETVANAFFGTTADIVMVGDTSQPYNLREVASSYLMQPGEGYVVHVLADSTWVVDW